MGLASGLAALIEHQTGGFALELGGKGTALFGHQTPLCREHSRLNGCPESLDHYTCPPMRVGCCTN